MSSNSLVVDADAFGHYNFVYLVRLFPAQSHHQGKHRVVRPFHFQQQLLEFLELIDLLDGRIKGVQAHLGLGEVFWVVFVFFNFLDLVVFEVGFDFGFEAVFLFWEQVDEDFEDPGVDVEEGPDLDDPAECDADQLDVIAFEEDLGEVQNDGYNGFETLIDISEVEHLDGLLQVVNDSREENAQHFAFEEVVLNQVQFLKHLLEYQFQVLVGQEPQTRLDKQLQNQHAFLLVAFCWVAIMEWVHRVEAVSNKLAHNVAVELVVGMQQDVVQ